MPAELCYCIRLILTCRSCQTLYNSQSKVCILNEKLSTLAKGEQLLLKVKASMTNQNNNLLMPKIIARPEIKNYLAITYKLTQRNKCNLKAVNYRTASLDYEVLGVNHWVVD